MTTPQVTTRMNQAKRKAFTLVELMIVIAIIGILVAISSPFIFGALITAKEFTIKNEMFQLDAAVKRFETEHGFYPPAIGPGLEIDTAGASTDAVNTLRRYVNRIAPNNAEGTGTDGGGLNIWWRDVGSQLDAESSLVFWLSGLCTSKQYPLSGSAAVIAGDRALAAYNADKYFNQTETEAGPGLGIDRNVIYEFNFAHLVTSQAGISEIKSYNQPHGKGDLLAYRYRNSKSYSSSGSVANAYRFTDKAGNVFFYNADTFQIISPGMDGQVTGTPFGQTPETNTSILSQVGPASDVEQDDNITNFSGGRLDLVFE